MKLENLQATLNNRIQHGSLLLSNDILPDTIFSKLLQESFHSVLTVNDTVLAEDSDHVVLKGKTQYESTQSYPIEIKFWGSDEDIQGQILLKPDELTTSRLLSKLTDIDHQQFIEAKTDIAAIVLCSQKIFSSEIGLHYQQGLNLLAQLDLSDSVRQLSPLFASVNHLNLVGQINLTKAYPVLHCFSKPILSLPFGPMTAELSIGIRQLFNANVKDSDAADFAVLLKSDIQLFEQRVNLISDPLSEDAGSLLFAADLQDGGLPVPSLNSLLETLHLNKLDLLPEKYIPGGGMVINRFQCLLALADGNVDSIDVGLSSSLEFRLIPGKLVLKLVGLDLMVSDINDSPNVATALQAEIQLGNIILEADTLFPSTTVNVNFYPEQPLPITQLLDLFLPELQLPGVSVERISGQVDMDSGHFIFECAVTANVQLPFLKHLPNVQTHSTIYLAHSANSIQAAMLCSLAVGNTEIELGAKLGGEVELTGEFHNLFLSEAVSHLLNTEIAGMPEINIHTGYMMLKSNGDFSLTGSIDFNFSELLDAFDIGLPNTINKFALDTVALTGNLAAFNFNLRFGTNTVVPLLRNSSQSLSIQSGSFSLSSPAGVVVSLNLVGKTQLAEQIYLGFNDMALSFSSKDKSWSANNKAVLWLYDQDYELDIGLGDDHFRLNYGDQIVFSDLGGKGEISADSLHVFAESVGGGEGSLTRWGMGGNITIRQHDAAGQPWLELAGKLSLETVDGQNELMVSAKAPKLPDIPLNLGGAISNGPQLRLSLDDFGFEYTQSERKDAVWVLRANARMQILQIPSRLEKYLPTEELKGYFRTDGETTILGFEVPSTLQPDFPELALEFSNNKKLSLGQPQLAITKIALILDKNPQLIEEIIVGLPKKLNYLFGADAKGKSNMDLFYESFRIQLVLGKQLGIKLCTSPFKDLEFYEKEGKMWSDWCFGDLGEYSFQVPEFKFDNGRWMASAGFERLTDIKLPLKPIKFLLTKNGIPQAALAPIPDAIPIKGVDLRNNVFYAWITDILGEKVLGQIDPNATKILKDFTDVVQGAVERLPDRMQEYFDLLIPQSAILDITVDSAGGGLMIGFRILGDDPPLKILFPFLGAVPEIVGITVRGFSFGQKSGGALAMIEFDGHIDRFDILSLTAALAIGQGTDLSNRFLLNNTLVVIPSGIPLAIPLFFDELALEYKDVMGSEIQSYWKYPQPEMGLLEYLQLFTALFQFFTKDDYLLHKVGLSEVIPLQFTVGINTIRLPDFLGGGTIGLRTAFPPVNVANSITRLLDSLKTGNAGYAIEAIPLRVEDHWIRIGSIDVHFGPVEMNAHWCITTEEEFSAVVLPEVQGDSALSTVIEKAVLKSLPRDENAPVYEKGFIVLLAGGVTLGKIAGFRAQFGMALTVTGGFETGVRLLGTIADSISLTLGGRIRSSESKLEIEGNVNLTAFDQVLIDSAALIAVSDTSFEAEVRLLLTKKFSLAGTLLIGSGGLSLSGTIEWVFGKGPIKLVAEGGMHFSEIGMVISGTGNVYGIHCSIDVKIPGESDAALFHATISLDFPDFMELFAGDLKAGATKAKKEIEDASKQVSKALDALSEVDLNVNSFKSMIVNICDTATHDTNARVNALPSSKTYTKKIYKKVMGKKIHVKTIKKTVYPRTEAQKEARGPIQDLANLRKAAQSDTKKTLGMTIEDALNKVIENYPIKVTIDINLSVTSYRRTFYNRDMLTKTQITQLTNLKNNIHEWIGKLPERESNVRLRRDYVETLQNSATGRLSEIENAIDNEISDAIPRVDAIWFISELQIVKKTEQEIKVVIKRGDHQALHTVNLDFGNPAKASKALFQSFANTL